MSTLEMKVEELLKRKKSEPEDISTFEVKGETAPKAPEPDFHEEHIVMPTLSTTKKYSELFGTLPPSGTDWDVECYEREDWDEDSQAFIPDASKFADYVINHEVMEQLVLGTNSNLKLLVVGPTGSGKTSIQELFCAYTNRPYYRVNGRGDMESDTLLGKPWVADGSMHFELGELPKAVAKGWYIAFDEPWKTPAPIQMALQRFYEKDGILQIDDMPGTLSDKQIQAHTRCRVVLSDNSVGTGDGADVYGATTIQDGSTLNRMDMVISMPYMDKQSEAEMVTKKYPAIPEKIATKMVQFFNLIRVSFEKRDVSAAVSPRNYDAWCKLAVQLKDINKACVWTVLNRYAEDSEKAIIKDHYRTVFGKELG